MVMLESRVQERETEIGEVKDQLTLVRSTNKLQHLLHSDEEENFSEEDEYEEKPRVSNPIDLKLMHLQNVHDLEAVCEEFSEEEKMDKFHIERTYFYF